MRFIATADWQLGMTAHQLDDDARPRFQQARFDAVRRIGEVAKQNDASFVLVCGDVFESNQLKRTVVARAFEAMRACPAPIVLLPGNHDPLDAASIYDSPDFARQAPDHVRVIRDSSPFEVVPGVEIVGAPWKSKRPGEDLVAAACAGLTPAPEGVVRVLAGHGAVSALNPDQDAEAVIDVANLTTALDAGVIHAAILGDRHSTTMIEPRVWYPGTPEVTHRRETDPGNVLIVDLGDTVKAQPVRTGRWRFITMEGRLDSATDVAAFAARLRDTPDKERTAVWLALSGTLSTSAHARLIEELADASEVFARLDHWERHTDLAVLPDEHDFDDLELSGFARHALDELTETAASDGEDAGVAQDALALLFRLARRR